MKPKKVTKKLVLNKESITNLDREELNNARGGTIETIRCTAYSICIFIPCGPDL
jgi:natural product precursor